MADNEYSTRAVDWLREAEPDVQEQAMSKMEQAAKWPDHFFDTLLYFVGLYTACRRIGQL